MIKVIKNKPGKTSRMIEKTLSEDTDFNNFIKENVREVEKWIIYANDNFFSKENRINLYQRKVLQELLEEGEKNGKNKR